MVVIWYYNTVNIFKIIMDLIVPEEQKMAKLLDLEASAMRRLLPASPTNMRDILVLFDYRNKMVRFLVKSIKYKNHAGLKKRIAQYFIDEILEISEDIALFEGGPPLIVPMPMSKQEKRKKGFNQCEELVREIEKNSGHNINISYNALKKIRETKRQTTLSREERLENVKNSMQAMPEKVRNKTVIVIDDVYTTLASFSEARRALHSAGARRTLGFFIAH